MWFVFQVGFRTGEVSGHPFIVWLLCGLAPWYFFSDAWSSATASVSDNSFLVRKVAFRLSLLPVVKICSSLIVHVFFLGILLVVLISHGYTPTIHIIQTPIILGFLCLFALGLGLTSASLIIFVKDVAQLIQLLLQLGFWFTPIFWSATILPEPYSLLAKLNPMYFVIMGFRASLIDHIWLTEHPLMLTYFALVSVASFACGALVFSKLRPHFADVI